MNNTQYDEHAAHEAFEIDCGGPDKAFRLLHIWQECANPVWGTFPHTESEKAAKRLEIFKRRAKNERYTDKQVRLFLALQGH